jgi:hypothetical protein
MGVTELLSLHTVSIALAAPKNWRQLHTRGVTFGRVDAEAVYRVQRHGSVLEHTPFGRIVDPEPRLLGRGALRADPCGAGVVRRPPVSETPR